MKRWLASLILFALTASASTVRLAWDASDPSDGITNYVIYASSIEITNTLVTGMAKVNVGTNTTARVENLTAGKWWFTVTAINNQGIESDISNVIVIEVPKPPTAMRVVVLQYSGTLTNFYDVGFFKLRLP